MLKTSSSHNILTCNKTEHVLETPFEGFAKLQSI